MAWARIQSAFAGSSASTVSATYGTALSSGTKLIAVTGSDGGDAVLVSSVKDGAGNAMTQLAVMNQAGNGNAQVQLWAMDTPAGDVGATPTITATWASSIDGSLLIQEVSGLLAGNTTAMIDGTAGTSNGSGGGNTTSPAYSSTAANEYLVACFSDNAFTDTVTDPSSPWTSDASNPAGAGVVHAHLSYKNSSNGAESGAVFNYSNAGAHYAELMVAFKLAAGVSHTDTAALTVTPGRTDTQVHGHNPAAALTVAPGRANVAAYGKNPKLVLGPVFAAVPSGGSKRKGGIDRHRWWKP